MTPEGLFFFRAHPEALPIYMKLEERILARIPDVKIRVSKTQIGFSNKRLFAAASFNPCRRAADRPTTWMTVTFGLGERKEHPRIDAAAQPYPNRWTHHVTVGSCEEIDEELMAFIGEAAAFSAAKR